jgi:Na+(H+)/acetate symporter ActP
MRILRSIAVTVAGGALIAVVLFYLSAPMIGGCCHRVGTALGTTIVTTPGWIDPWTGEIRLETETSTDVNGQSITKVREQSFEDHLVIPLPVGFVVGSFLTLAVITIVSRRSRRAAPNPVVPAA